MTNNIIQDLVRVELDRTAKNVQSSNDAKKFFSALKNTETPDSEIPLAVEALENLIEELAKKGESRDETVARLDDWARRYRSPLGLTEDVVDGEYVYGVLRTRLPGKKIGQTEIEARQGRRGGFRLKTEITRVIQKTLEITLTEADQASVDKALERESNLERSLYEPARVWALTTGYDKCVIAGNARRQGKWGNPDLIEIVAEFDHYSGTARWYITAIEVKPRLIPEAVWQAASYKSFAHEAYVAFGLTESQLLINDDKVLQLAVELGVGILCLTDQSSSDERVFKRIHFPTRGNPTQESVEEALKKFHKQGNRNDEISRLISSQEDAIKPELKRRTFANLQHETIPKTVDSG
jgi:hypothetical protein